MKRYWIVLIFLAVASCDFLNTEPQDIYTTQKALQTSQGIEQALVGVYDGLQSPNLYGGNLSIIGELMAGNLEKSGKNTISESYEEFYNREISTNNPIVLGIWKDAYQVINQTNLILENVNNISDQQQKEQIKGECLYIRALVHFELSRYFTSPDSGLAVPYLTKTAKNSDFLPTRDSISVFYDKLFADFEESKTLLISKNTNPNRATYWAVEAILARLYFQQNNYEKAFVHADNVIQNSPFSLASSIQNVFSENDDSESIFRLQSTSSDNSGAFLNEFYNIKKVQGGSFSVSPIFKTLLDKNLSDTRRFVFHLFEDSKVFVRKYDDSNFPDGVSFPVVRLSEMYLIRAEINTDNQLDREIIRGDYNLIRLRAGLPEDRATSSPVALLRNIHEERLKELAWEGDIFHDKKRRGENFGALSAQDSRLVLPIPQREINLNPNLVQNTGY